MLLVIDANIVFSMIINLMGKTRELLFRKEISLVAPEHLKQEIEEHREEIKEKSGLSETDFEIAIALILSPIRLVPYSEFAGFISSAKKSCPDPEDIAYFAVALALNCPIWSNDKILQKQDSVKVLSTSEILQLFP